MESIVYGCIKHLPFGELDERRASCFTNRRVIHQLPMTDAWPFICREMFAVPSDEILGGQYKTQVVHFGMAYHGVEYEWSSWVEKFEDLLRKMYWVSAVVHLETELSGVHTFMWESSELCHEPGGGDLNVRCEWSREAAIA